MESTHNHSEMLFGTCRQLLFSRTGDIEGVLVSVKGRTVQVSMTIAEGAALAETIGPGKRMRLLATAQLFPVPGAAPHPLYKFLSLSDTGGDPLPLPFTAPGESALAGQVSAVHYATSGEANGVLLDTGEFIHIGAAGMLIAGLRVGSKVRAIGSMLRTVTGSRMLAAGQVNGAPLRQDTGATLS